MRIARRTIVEAIAALEAHNADVRSLAESGDAGWFDPEAQPSVVRAERAIAELRAALGTATP